MAKDNTSKKNLNKPVKGNKPWDSESLAYVILVLWVLASLYFGFVTILKNKLDSDLGLPSGQKIDVTQKGIHIDNAKKLLIDREIESIEYFFPWFNDVHEMTFTLLGAFALGSLGGVIRLIWKVTKKKKKLQDMKYIHEIFLSGCMGLVILAISSCFFSLAPMLLSFLSLLAGIYYRGVYVKTRRILIEKMTR